MCIDIVHIPYVKSLSLISSDLLQRIFVCVALACGWPAYKAPAGSLAAGTLAVNDILIGVCRWLAPLWQGYLPHTHTHSCTQTYIHHTFSARQWWDNFYLHSPFGSGWLCELVCVGARWVTRTVFAKAYATRFPFGIPDIRGSPFLQLRIWLITAGN